MRIYRRNYKMTDKVTDLEQYELDKTLELLQSEGLIDYKKEEDMIGFRVNTAVQCAILNEIMSTVFSKSDYDTVREGVSCESEWKENIRIVFALRVLANKDLKKKCLINKGKIIGKIAILSDLEEDSESDDKVILEYKFALKNNKKVQSNVFETRITDIELLESAFIFIDLDNPIDAGENKIKFTVLKNRIDYLIERAKNFGEEIVFKDGLFYRRSGIL